MDITRESLQNIFYETVVGCEPLCDAFGIRIKFEKTCDLSRLLRQQTGAKAAVSYYSDPLYELVYQFGVVVLGKARFARAKNLALTSVKNENNFLMQDSFHCDFLQADTSDKITLIERFGEERKTPTYYAHIDDIKAAISKLDRTCVKHEAYDGLDIMRSAKYMFSIKSHELPARELIQKYFPEFVESVFALIPPNRKFSQDWSLDYNDDEVCRVVMHSNKPGRILHGRPQGRVDENNSLYGYRISPETPVPMGV